MYDIKIKNMVVFAYHGVLESERLNGQPFIFDILIKVNDAIDFCDDINKTIDYSHIFDLVKSFTTKNTFNLIETLGDALCDEILLISDKIQSVNIEIKKPHAPINAEFEYVSVNIEKKRNTVYLSLGSNLGDKHKNLADAIEKTSALKFTKIHSTSKFYITSPVGYENQDDFLNCCLKINTLLNPHALLASLKIIENEMFRQDTVRFGPRTIDIDILLFNDDIIISDILVIPHGQMLNRKFVLVPLLDIYNDDILKQWEFRKALSKLSDNNDNVELFLIKE